MRRMRDEANGLLVQMRRMGDEENGLLVKARIDLFHQIEAGRRLLSASCRQCCQVVFLISKFPQNSVQKSVLEIDNVHSKIQL